MICVLKTQEDADMKALVIGNRDRFEKYMPEDIGITKELELVFCKRGSSDGELLAAGRDADFIAADRWRP